VFPAKLPTSSASGVARISSSLEAMKTNIYAVCKRKSLGVLQYLAFCAVLLAAW